MEERERNKAASAKLELLESLLADEVSNPTTPGQSARDHPASKFRFHLHSNGSGSWNSLNQVALRTTLLLRTGSKDL